MTKNILVIEDEVHLQKLISFILEREGHKVASASNGQDGLNLLASGYTPDLVILDILMPGMDGLTVLKHIRADQKNKNVPVMLLTALAQENVVLQGTKLGVKEYIRKPFQPKELAARVAKHLGLTEPTLKESA